jgi:hypothetical protein
MASSVLMTSRFISSCAAAGSLAACLLVLSAAPAHADRADRRAVEALERQWLAAPSDRVVLERILADDFAHPVPAGVVLTKAQHISWAVAHPRPAGRRARFERLEVRLYGDTAIATGIVDNTDAAGGDLQRSLFTDVFVRRHGAWRAVNALEKAVGR